VDGVVAGHLGHVRERLASLKTLERQLELLQQACSHSSPQEVCGIVLALSQPQGDAPASPAVRGVHSQ
jgi:hypothetical protein